MNKKIDADLSDKLAALPDKPGVYLFKDSRGQIIYIGKAKSLRHRVRSYFTSTDDGRCQYPRLVAAIRNLEILLTYDDVEALKTEQALIRLHRPKYNVELRDDKSFPYLKITREPFPRIFLTRKPRMTGADYYGPYTDAAATRGLIRTLKGALQVRDCNLPLSPEKIAAGKFKLCLDYHIGRCGGPCEGKVLPEDYDKGVQQFKRFLQGGHDEIVGEMEREMRRLSDEQRYEEAAVLRDRLRATRRFCERQTKISLKPINRDAIGFAREDNHAAFSVIKVRGGRITGQSPFHMDRTQGMDDASLMEAFVVRYYQLADLAPQDVLLPLGLPNEGTVSAYLSRAEETDEPHGRHAIRFSTPKRGERRKLVDTAMRNADHLIAERRLSLEKRDFVPRAVTALQECLKLPCPPMLIEAFDISNLHGSDSVASLVVFKSGKPFKSAYRIFRIKSVAGVDDFASIHEAVKRRYQRLKNEIAAAAGGKAAEAKSPSGVLVGVSEEQNLNGGDDAPRFPDLVLIDGGKGQLSSAKWALKELGLSEVPVIGLAKRLEEIYLPGSSDPLTLPRTSSALRLLQQVRDEAHRFAISKHRILRGKRQIKSQLDDIPGIGPMRRQALLQRFRSLKGIAAAGFDEIASLPGMTPQASSAVFKAFHSESVL